MDNLKFFELMIDVCKFWIFFKVKTLIKTDILYLSCFLYKNKYNIKT